MTETLKPCRECGAPCSVQVFPNATLWVCSHNKKLKGGCPSDTAYLSAEDWNAHAPDNELAILRAEVTRLRQINAGNEAATVAGIVTFVRRAVETQQAVAIIYANHQGGEAGFYNADAAVRYTALADAMTAFPEAKAAWLRLRISWADLRVAQAELRLTRAKIRYTRLLLEKKP